MKVTETILPLAASSQPETGKAGKKSNDTILVILGLVAFLVFAYNRETLAPTVSQTLRTLTLDYAPASVTQEIGFDPSFSSDKTQQATRAVGDDGALSVHVARPLFSAVRKIIDAAVVIGKIPSRLVRILSNLLPKTKRQQQQKS
mmetsp:Transcript_1036/g.2233  ORF Transcript_1036/g.2233 Transcript_1036/m.2233 type:complete len:145 (-) Transcript_1036:350-784(-)|eukprot:CAMPEP_0194323380 /NCGR_PEP_ID=MMETSP0171-20130528/25507_1 /TAXON_ID=218684 /ORGANISM="Corethron pennatum, Strain L29A3" /LENGTH=144 /DNA_ID=CAMNT_0039082017 /DNA_START=83 /DNA_END=517 /DNA_ORIENTATION=-